MNDATGPRLIWARDLDRLPARAWLAGTRDRIIPAQGLVCLYGPPGAGKSFLTLDLACQVALQHPVIYVCSEGLSGVAARVRAWCQHHGHVIADLRLAIWPGAAYLAASGESDFSAFYVAVDGVACEHGRPPLIVFDTVSNELDAVGADDVDGREMGQLVVGAKTVRDAFGCAVLLVHHTNAEGTRERGNNKIRQAMDTMIEVDTDEERVTMTVNKQKDGFMPAPREFYLLPVTLQDADGRPLADEDGLPITSCVAIDVTGQPTPVPAGTIFPHQRKVLTALVEAGDEGLVWGKLATFTDLKDRRMQKTISQLVKRGYVAKGDGHGAAYRITPGGQIALTQSMQTSTLVVAETRTPPPHTPPSPPPDTPTPNGHKEGSGPQALIYVGDAHHERRALELAWKQGMGYFAREHATIIRDEERRRYVLTEIARIRGG